MHLLITGAWRDADRYFDRLKSMGHEICFMQQEKDALPCKPDWVEGLIGNGFFLYHPIEQFENLRYIQLTSAGYDRVPMDYIQMNHIKIHNARGVYSIAMAEFAMCGVLQLYKQSKYFMNNQEQYCWNKHRGLLELYHKNVCIVGCGNVGTECAKRFAAFGCNVYGVDKYPQNNKNYLHMLPLNELDRGLTFADVVILTLPLTEETLHLMDDTRFSNMKEGAVIVNIARGALVDTDAFVRHLPHLRGAVLDVFEEEPLQHDHFLWQLENVLISPHNSFVSDGNACRLAGVILDNLEDNDENTSNVSEK